MKQNDQQAATRKLLRDLTLILNAHQDIADELAKDKPSLKRINSINGRIGKAVVRLLPG